MIRLEVLGIPAPQGSKTRMPNGAMVDGTSKTGRAKLAEWRRAVADAARTWLEQHPGERPLPPYELAVTFRFAPTASDPYRWHHAVNPDASKVLRATEDALVQAGLIADDRYISDLNVAKRFAHDEHPGATIDIISLAESEAAYRLTLKEAAKARRRTPRPLQEALL